MQNNANSRKAQGQQNRSTSADTPKWEAARGANANATIISAVVDSVATKDGRPRGLNVTLQLGENLALPSFIPGSEIQKGVSQKELVGKTIEVKVIEVNRRKGRLISSLKVVADEQRDSLLSSLAEEQEVQGTVARKTDFGYFVELGNGVDALLHITQTALVNGKPEELTIGQVITAKVRSVNVEEGKVALTMRKPRPEQARGNRMERFQTRTSRKTQDRILALPKSAPAPKADKPKAPRKLNTTKKNPFEVCFTSEGGNPFEQLAKHWADKNSGEQVTEVAPAAEVAAADVQVTDAAPAAEVAVADVQ